MTGVCAELAKLAELAESVEFGKFCETRTNPRKSAKLAKFTVTAGPENRRSRTLREVRTQTVIGGLGRWFWWFGELILVVWGDDFGDLGGDV